MTPEQNSLFVFIMSSGIACGVDHPIECYMNYMGSMGMFPYDDIPRLTKEAEETMVAFYRNCAGGPDDPVGTLTKDGLVDMINLYYKEAK